MLSDITIGQYYPGRSLLHRLDPRVKIILLLLLMAEIFIFSNWPAYAALIALTGGLMLASAVPVLVLLKSVRPLLWIIVLTFIIHLLGTPGEALATLGPLTITWEGVTRGSFICLRLVLLILLSSLLTFTTSPVKLTDAMEALLSPFRRFGVPAHELAYDDDHRPALRAHPYRGNGPHHEGAAGQGRGFCYGWHHDPCEGGSAHHGALVPLSLSQG